MSEELKGRELGWDDEIEKGADYVLLPEGEYDFTIESFERGRFEGSDKVPACPRAELKVKVEAPEGMCLMNETGMKICCIRTGILLQMSRKQESCRSKPIRKE